MTWIFVCSNNLVRSVIAAAICRRLAPEIQVESAGLAESCKDRLNRQGLLRKRRLIAPVTRKFLEEKGYVETADMRARRLTEHDVKKADLIWVMTKRHRQTVLDKFPEADSKVRLLGNSEIKNSWKELTEERLAEWYDRIESALKTRLAEISQLP